jgi:hypothetical protein
VTEYAEDRAALRPAAVVLGVGLLAVFVAAVAVGAATGDEVYLLPAAIALFGLIFSRTMYVFVSWPAGIRIDADGVRIGNVRHPGHTRPPAPSFQAYRVFAVRWAGVLSMRVVTDRAELRRLTGLSRSAPTNGVRRRGGAAVGFYLGMLTAPLWRAALVVEIDQEYATFPDFRTHQAAAVATSQVGTRSDRWVVPTRRPERLAEVVEAITHSPEWNARRMG